MVFTCLEFLRGRYRTGQRHLAAGLKILGELELYGNKTRATKTDDEELLLEVFGRMRVLAMQLGQIQADQQQGYVGGGLEFHAGSPEAGSIPSSFESASQVRNLLDDIVSAAYQLKNMSRESHRPEISDKHAEEKRQLESHLEAWNIAYRASKSLLQGNILVQLSRQLLYLHYMAVNILVKAGCLFLDDDDEMVYDNYIGDFRSLLSHAMDFTNTVRQLHSSMSAADPAFSSDKSHLTIDMGWIPPLYFTALHCRDHETRWQAVGLLESIPSKEGIWDSSVAVAVAERVIRLEEGQSRVVSAGQRVGDVQVTLPDGDNEDITVTCRRPATTGRKGERITLTIQLHHQK